MIRLDASRRQLAPESPEGSSLQRSIGSPAIAARGGSGLVAGGTSSVTRGGPDDDSQPVQDLAHEPPVTGRHSRSARNPRWTAAHSTTRATMRCCQSTAAVERKVGGERGWSRGPRRSLDEGDHSPRGLRIDSANGGLSPLTGRQPPHGRPAWSGFPSKYIRGRGPGRRRATRRRCPGRRRRPPPRRNSVPATPPGGRADAGR